MAFRLPAFISWAAVTILASTAPTSPRPQEDPEETSEFSAHGFNTLRIEQEDKLTVPDGRAEAVWGFLRKWLVEDTTALKQLDPLFTSYWHEELFTDTYFDTPTLDLLAKQSGVRQVDSGKLVAALLGITLIGAGSIFVRKLFV